MNMSIREMNEQLFLDVKKFLQENHVNGDSFSEREIDCWVGDVLHDDNGRIEIRGKDSVTGNPVVFQM